MAFKNVNELIKNEGWDKPVNLTPPSMNQVKNYDQDKFEDMIDFISINRGDNVPMEDIYNQLLDNYGSDYEDLVKHAVSKWAE